MKFPSHPHPLLRLSLLYCEPAQYDLQRDALTGNALCIWDTQSTPLWAFPMAARAVVMRDATFGNATPTYLLGNNDDIDECVNLKAYEIWII